MQTRFYPFVSINNTIRLRQGALYARVSDLLEGSARQRSACRRAHSVSQALSQANRSHPKHPLSPLRRQSRSNGQGAAGPPDAQTKAYPLCPRTSLPSRRNLRRSHRRFLRTHGPPATYLEPQPRPQPPRPLGPPHNAIVIGRVFDDPPRTAIRSKIHPLPRNAAFEGSGRATGRRRCVHSKEFVAEENLFPEVGQAKKFLRII